MKNLTGEIFNSWKVLEEDLNPVLNKRYWFCECLICNVVYSVMQSNLTSYKTKMCRSCSLAKRKQSPKREDNPIYSIWKNMRSRCNNPNNQHYHSYGGRGIKICSEWDDFDQFVIDMGDNFSRELSLDRIDVNKGYSPENCRWATLEEQANNKRNSLKLFYRGEYYTEAQLAKATGVKRTTIQLRRSNGWSVEEMVNGKECLEKYRDITYKGTTYKSLEAVAKAFNIEPNTFRYRIRKGLTIEQAINYEKYSLIRLQNPSEE
jgi:hypothetical protein